MGLAIKWPQLTFIENPPDVNAFRSSMHEPPDVLEVFPTLMPSGALGVNILTICFSHTLAQTPWRTQSTLGFS